MTEDKTGEVLFLSIQW